MPTVDVIVPVRNEEEAIPLFLAEVAALELPDSVTLGVLFVEDSSTDGTRALLKRLAHERRDVTYYCLAKGFGQGAAVTFGLSRSTADAVIMMDGDGGHPVRVIRPMVRDFLDGADVVQCVRGTVTNRRAYREVASTLFQLGAYLLTGVDLRLQNVFFRLISRKVVDQILAEPRYWTYLRFPLPPHGALRTVEIDMEERRVGKSKYGFWRLVQLAIDGVLSLIPTSRFAALLGVAGLLTAALVWLGAWPLALVTLAGTAWIIRSYQQLRRGDLLQRMQVVDCGGVKADASRLSSSGGQ